MAGCVVDGVGVEGLMWLCCWRLVDLHKASGEALYGYEVQVRGHEVCM